MLLNKPYAYFEALGHRKGRLETYIILQRLEDFGESLRLNYTKHVLLNYTQPYYRISRGYPW